ncbi:MAG TPA: Do family serine endopeptidase [Dissulfurispiraceae bacterium]|nr:Do family serine endopeptidase [Dissulfurispiraceae bacterium]
MKKKASIAAKSIMVFSLFVLLTALVAVPVGADSGTLAQLSNDMAAITETARPVVVNIATSRTVKTPRLPFADDPFFKRFFGEQKGPATKKAISLGSGVIVSSDGYIITCNHVIESAEDIIVKTADNKEYKGQVIGTDAKTDVAIIKIDGKNLPAATFGDSDKLRSGEIVLAIGNPFSLNHTVTMGIVSALKRSGMGITEYEDFIQIDAAINPGNSGGALLNTKGELIGINNAIFSTSGGSLGIGFAIPVKMARSIMESMLTKGKVVRGYIGISIQPLTADLARQFALKDQNGALLVDVTEDGPAEKAGLERGDVMIEYDGKKIDSLPELKNWVAATPPGETVPVKVVRDGKTASFRVVMGELPGASPVQEKTASATETAKVVDNNLKGVVVREVTDDYLQKQGIKRRLKGVVITAISEESPALGLLERGDIILEINRKAVATQGDYAQVVSTIGKNQDVLLLIVRGGASQYLTVSSR